MIIRTSRCNLVYPKINNLRRKAIEIEDKLSPYFNQIILHPVPDEAPEEIPRISTSSHNGHSHLNISLTNAQITTNFDDEYNRDWKKCITYVKERAFQIARIFQSYSSEGFLFSGLTTELVIDELEGQDPLSLIKERFLNYRATLSPHDIEYKLTFVIENRFYVNITLSNLRFYEGLFQQGAFPRIAGLKEQAHVLGVILDINDRFAFNFNEKYFSTFSQLEKVINLTDEIISNKLDQIIREGVFEL